jgi:DNA-binding GntR family transcriptional regulator
MSIAHEDLPGSALPAHATLQEFLADAINASILDGRLKPGERISPEHLARQMHTSHIPVREALHQLEGQGQVTRIAYRGFYVPELSLADFEDAHLWREVLENKAYTLAATRLTPDHLVALWNINTKIEAAVERKDLVGYARCNREFHLYPAVVLESESLTRFLTHLWNVCDLYFATLIRAAVVLPVLQEHHRELIAAFEAKNARMVVKVMRAHRHVTMDVINKALATE